MSGGSHHEMLYRAVSLVLKYEGFSLPSLPARRAREAAEKFLEWGGDSENKPAWKAFAETLIRSLEGCFQAHRSIRSQRERMWESYHKLRSSRQFKDMWATLLAESIATEVALSFTSS